MKPLRLWLLLLLAILSPLRGAIAATGPFEGAGQHAPARHPAAHHHDCAMAAVAGHVPAPVDHRDSHGSTGKCSLCACCCAATPLPVTFSPAIALLEEPATRFPPVHAPASTFVSDGQERPPRTL